MGGWESGEKGDGRVESRSEGKEKTGTEREGGGGGREFKDNFTKRNAEGKEVGGGGNITDKINWTAVPTQC